MKRLYDWTLSLAGRRHAPAALGAVSFAESSFFPIPPDILLVPMMLAHPERAWRYALICTLTSVAGGLLGYAIGALLFDSVGGWLISAYGYGGKLDEFRRLYAEWGALIILIKGLTPIPYKLVTIASGFAGYDLLWFVLLSIVTRGARFFLVAALMSRYGSLVRRLMDEHAAVVMGGLAVVIVGGFVASKYLF
jgi:membrane protein YqaA with SNARE-associated domain